MSAASEQAAALHVAEARRRVEALRDALADLPDWAPGDALTTSCADALARMDGLESDMARPLIVLIVGACGVGKSTLLNALAHRPGLSATGPTRPTTNAPVAFVRQRDDAAPLEAAIPGGRLRVVVDAAGTAPAHLVLVDTPDTNSVAGAAHRRDVDALLRVADVLLCLFSAADNPKAADQLAYLAPLVSRFPREWLYVGLSQVDRLTDEERKGVAADFARHLAVAWPKTPKACYLLAARAHELGCGVEDEFRALESELRDVLGRADRPADVRAARAQALADAVEGEESVALEAASAALDAALQAAADFGRRQAALLARWIAAPPADDRGAEASVAHLGGPFGTLLRLVSRLRSKRAARRAQRSSEAGNAGSRSSPLGILRLDVARHWPDLASRLHATGFKPGSASDPLPSADVARVEAEIEAAVASLRRRADEAAASALSRPWLSVVLTTLFVAVPVAGLLQGLWTVFVERSALPARYLRSVVGLWTASTLVLVFVVLWGCRVVRRLAWRRAVRAVPFPAADGLLRDVPVLRQLRCLDALRRQREISRRP